MILHFGNVGGKSIVLEELEVGGIGLEVRLETFRVEDFGFDFEGAGFADGDAGYGTRHCVYVMMMMMERPMCVSVELVAAR